MTGHLLVVIAARRREADPPVMPVEQPDAQMILEKADLPADGGRRHAEFLSGGRDAGYAPHDVEDTQRVERGERIHMFQLTKTKS
ncbi:hypothetical protein D3C78_1572570 [compost metagenome]